MKTRKKISLEKIELENYTIRIPVEIKNYLQELGHGALSRFVLSAIVEKWNKSIKENEND